MSKAVMRTAKNSIKGYSDAQTKVREATSNDPWGPSGTQMSEIAALTFNQNDFVEIIEMLDKRLNDKGKNWRHVFKSLTLLDYILHSGSENVVMYFRENMYIIKTLKEFQFVDEYGKDQGANVRQKAKDITNLLLDDKRMRDSRRSRANMNGRLQGEGESSRPSPRERETPRRSQTAPARDSDLEAAIAASKRTAEEEARGQKSRGRGGGEDELEEALRLSREEEERRKRELAGQAGGSLFDDQANGTSSNGNNNNLIDMETPFQQPMQTGLQFASYNPYAQQQQQQMQEEWMRQQQMQELQRQADAAAYQQMLQQQAYAQQQQQAQDEYLRQQAYQQQYLASQQQQQQQQMQPLQPQPTAFGANNPFAAFAPSPSAASPPPALPHSTSFDAFSTPQSQQSIPPPSVTPASAPVQRPMRTDDPKHAELARMLAGGREDGIDTFGNMGNLRVPVGHQFATKTGGGGRPNPFVQQQQGQQQQGGQQQSDQPFFQL